MHAVKKNSVNFISLATGQPIGGSDVMPKQK
jgi:hypothetical protein